MSRFQYYKRLLKRKWLEFKYRQKDQDVCCCGSYLPKDGQMCANGTGGCLSLVEYVIQRELDKK